MPHKKNPPTPHPLKFPYLATPETQRFMLRLGDVTEDQLKPPPPPADQADSDPSKTIGSGDDDDDVSSSKIDDGSEVRSSRSLTSTEAAAMAQAALDAMDQLHITQASAVASATMMATTTTNLPLTRPTGVNTPHSARLDALCRWPSRYELPSFLLKDGDRVTAERERAEERARRAQSPPAAAERLKPWLQYQRWREEAMQYIYARERGSGDE